MKKMNNCIKDDEDVSFDAFLSSIDDAVAIEQKLISARKKMNLTQEDVAKKCGIKQSAIARFEAGTVIPRIDTVIRYAKAVNFSIKAISNESDIGNITVKYIISKNACCSRKNNYYQFPANEKPHISSKLIQWKA